MQGKNFYERLDEIFKKLITENPEYFNKEFLKMKSEIIKAYEYDNNHKGEYLAKVMKVKQYDITDDGKIVFV
jgi:hypothetical protein